VIAVGNDSLFRALCRHLGLRDLSEDPRFSSPPARSAHRIELRAILVESLRHKSATDWAALLQAAGVPAAPILDVQGGIDAATKLGLAPVVEAGSGDRVIPGIRNPIGFSRTAPSYDWAPPLLDEGRSDILDWLVGARATPEKGHHD
jgi:crotonobetainyl-CoA:carnitine CoA-transferase CaiB-like acyl-CoA transferase